MGYGWKHWAVVRGKHGHTHRLCEYASLHTMGYGRFGVNRARQQQHHSRSGHECCRIRRVAVDVVVRVWDSRVGRRQSEGA